MHASCGESEYSDEWDADHSQSRDLCRQQSLLERTGGETVDGDAQSCRRRIIRRLLAAERCSPIRWAADTRVKLGRLEGLADEDMLLMNHLVKRLESALIRQAVSLVEGSSRAATQKAMPFWAPATRRHPAMAGGCASSGAPVQRRLAVEGSKCKVVEGDERELHVTGAMKQVHAGALSSPPPSLGKQSTTS